MAIIETPRRRPPADRAKVGIRPPATDRRRDYIKAHLDTSRRWL